MGVVITHRASGVINFAHGALGMYVAFAYYEFRGSGDLILPIIGLPDRVHLLDRPTEASAFVICMVAAALLGAVIYLLVFRPLRDAPALARVVASLGLMTYFIGIVGVRVEGAAASSLRIEGPLPTDLVTILGVQAPADRWWLAALTVVAGGLLSLGYRYTRIGLATRAAADNERGAESLGLSPTLIGVANWAGAVMLAGCAVILAAPITGLDVGATSLLVVPALGAALVGRFESVAIAVAAGLGIGMLQSELLNLQADVDWLPDIGLQQGVPFLVVIVALVWRSDRLPSRGTITESRLPVAPDPGRTVPLTVALCGLAAAGLFFLDSEWRLAIIVSAIAAVISLSVVVLTGLVGQISLATFALAGIGAFSMVRVAEDLGLPFPLAPLVGIIIATAVGAIAGIPAVRVRGLTLAVTTLAAAIAVEELVFKWSWFTGGATGSDVPSPSLFGVDLGIGAVGDAYPARAFGVLVLVVLVVCMAIVVNLRKRATGRRWLAVRANERAAEAVGISVVEAKLTANAVACALAATGGVLIAYQSQVISAGSFGALESLVVVAVTYLAGIASPAAALLAGALATGGLLTVAIDSISDDGSKYQFALNGLLLIIVAIRFPEGIVGTVGAALRRRSSRGQPPEPEPDPELTTVTDR